MVFTSGVSIFSIGGMLEAGRSESAENGVSSGLH
jgi:ABC-type glucose/galactose transport system permease subunit